MAPQIYYLDNSVFENYKDEVRGEITDELINQNKMNKVHIIVSKLLYAELVLVPAKINRLMQDYPVGSVECLQVTAEVEILATEYILSKIVGKEMLPACRQIALATVNKADVFISWNYDDIVNFRKVQEFNDVNNRLGYPSLMFRSPEDYIYKLS